MQVKVDRDIFLTMLKVVRRAVAPQWSNPVLGNVLLMADESTGALILGCCDLAKFISAKVEVEFGESGSITVPAKTLTDWVEAIGDDDELTLGVDHNTKTLHIACSHSTARVKGIDATEFPTWIWPKAAAPRIVFDGGDFVDAVRQVVVCSSGVEDRPILNSVLVRVLARGRVCMAAADGFRLAQRTITPLSMDDSDVEAIVPSQAIREFANIVSASVAKDADVVVAIGETASFECGDVIMGTLLVDGKYPNYENIIPKESETNVTVTRRKLATALKTALVFAKSDQRIAKMTVGDYNVRIKASEDNDSGESSVSADVDGNGIEIGFNARLLSDMLSSVRGDSATIQMTTRSSPAMATETYDNGDYVHVLMPLHLSSYEV